MAQSLMCDNMASMRIAPNPNPSWRLVTATAAAQRQRGRPRAAHPLIPTSQAQPKPLKKLHSPNTDARTVRLHASNPTTGIAITPSAAGLTYLPSLSRQSRDPLPPLGSKATGLIQLGEGLWCLRQDFMLLESIYLNTHIVRLRSGGLMLVNPPAATEEAMALLGSLTGKDRGGCAGSGGDIQVEHVVLINLSPEHWYNAPDWAPHCAANATLWTVPGLLQGRSTASLLGGFERVRRMKEVYGRVLELPNSGPLPGLEAEVEVATFHESGGWFSESTLWFRDHQAALFGDMAFAAFHHRFNSPLFVSSSRILGIYQRLGCPIVYTLLLKDKQIARAWLDRVMHWEVDRVLASHFDALVPNGAAEIRSCFAFLLG